MEYKTVFIVDPVKGERLQLAKFIMQENFTIMGFTNISDCMKRMSLISCDLIIYVLRPGKTDFRNLVNRAKKKDMNYIIVTTPDAPEVNLEEARQKGFVSISKASGQEKVRELAYGILAPDGLKPRTEQPHPIPIPFI